MQLMVFIDDTECWNIIAGILFCKKRRMSFIGNTWSTSPTCQNSIGSGPCQVIDKLTIYSLQSIKIYTTLMKFRRIQKERSIANNCPVMSKVFYDKQTRI